MWWLWANTPSILHSLTRFVLLSFELSAILIGLKALYDGKFRRGLL
jgi:hypothetical protein